MEVILIREVENLGSKHDIVKVKPGYARNFLLPRKLAVTANDSNKRMTNELVRQGEKREERETMSANQIADQLKNVMLTIGTKVGTTGKIFGSVTNHHVAEALAAKGFNIDRRKISLPEDVKTVGSFSAVVDLHRKVKVQINFEVVGE